MALERGECPRVYCPLGNRNAIVIQPASDATFTAGGKQAGVRGPSGASLQPMPRVRAARAGCRAVRDSTLVAWYRSIYAPRTGGAYDSHHRTAEIAGCTRRCSRRVAAGGANAAERADAG